MMHSKDPATKPASGSDTELLRAARAGSEAAFAELHRLYARRLYRKIYSIMKNHEEAEDVLQDTLMRAFAAIDSFEGRSKLLSWLTRIAINNSLMALRKRHIRREAGLEVLSLSDDEVLPLQVQDSSPDPEQTCIHRERRLYVARAVADLKPAFRTVLEIQLSRECSMKELARALDVSVPTVKSRLCRARRDLAECAKNETRVPLRTGTNG
jgi:RNA polymerase sigma-70 factor, ECF subfamily